MRCGPFAFQRMSNGAARRQGLIGFGCLTIARLAREGGGLGGIWLEPSDTVLMVRRILSAEADARPRMSCSAGFVRHKNRRGQIGPMSSASNGWSAFYHG